MNITICIREDMFDGDWCNDSNNRCRFLTGNQCVLFQEELDGEDQYGHYTALKSCDACKVHQKEAMDMCIAWKEQEKLKLRYSGLI